MAILANGQVVFEDNESGSVMVGTSNHEFAIIGLDEDLPWKLEVLTRGLVGMRNRIVEIDKGSSVSFEGLRLERK